MGKERAARLCNGRVVYNCVRCDREFAKLAEYQLHCIKEHDTSSQNTDDSAPRLYKRQIHRLRYRNLIYRLADPHFGGPELNIPGPNSSALGGGGGENVEEEATGRGATGAATTSI